MEKDIKRNIVCITEDKIKAIASHFNLDIRLISEVIDTSRNENDKRYAYIINENEYVIKISNSSVVCEEHISPIVKLIKRYREIEVYAPAILLDNEGRSIYEFTENDVRWRAYVEEYAKYPVYEENEKTDYEFKKQMLSHVGLLASKFSNQPLCNHYSMWTIIHLHELDTDIDEKQDNLNQLCSALKAYDMEELAIRIEEENSNCRDFIKKHIDNLPTCTYQGDLNSTNILVDSEKNFAGIIDFNMYGEEVNINCFINECMYYFEDEDFEKLSGKEIVEKMDRVFEALLESILKHYTFNDLEKEVFPYYKKIIYLSFFPNVMNMIEQMKRYKDKVKEILESII